MTRPTLNTAAYLAILLAAALSLGADGCSDGDVPIGGDDAGMTDSGSGPDGGGGGGPIECGPGEHECPACDGTSTCVDESMACPLLDCRPIDCGSGERECPTCDGSTCVDESLACPLLDCRSVDGGRVWRDCESLTSEHEGEPCEGDFTCYGTCPDGTVTITCEAGTVHVDGECAPDGGSGCPAGEQRYEPGCGPIEPDSGIRELPSAGCYQPCAEGDEPCPTGTTCESAWIDPCAGSSCRACGGEAALCLTDREPVTSGGCYRSVDHTCETDADCGTGGCSGEVCQNVSEPPVVSTCDCTAPTDANCGCVDGTCVWYQ